MTDGLRKRDLEKVGSQLPIGKTVDSDFKQKSRAKDSDLRDYMRAEFAKRG